MSRLIKFRVWDTTTKKFMRSFQNNGLVFGHGSDQNMSEFGAYGIDQILNDFTTLVVMQFTGLYDSAGIEIYEGDLVKACKPNSYLDGVYQVSWHETKGRWYYSNQPSYKDLYQVGRVGNQRCIVVGNVFEHPELKSKED